MRWLVLLAALTFTASASAFNAPNPKLDEIATAFAQKPVSVWCETSDYDWQAMTGDYWTSGFTRLEAPVVYISPRACWTLQVALQRGYRDAGNEPMAYALLTLLHESAHQRGVTDEGAADCSALDVIGGYAVRYFGYQTTRTVQKVVRRWRTLTIRHKRVRVLVPVVVKAKVPDYDYTRLLANAIILHRGKGPVYQGNC